MKNIECNNCYWYSDESNEGGYGKGYCTNRDANSTCVYNAYHAWEPKYRCESTAPWACNYLVHIIGGEMTGCSGIESCKYCIRISCKDEEKAQSEKKKDEIKQFKGMFQ